MLKGQCISSSSPESHRNKGRTRGEKQFTSLSCTYAKGLAALQVSTNIGSRSLCNSECRPVLRYEKWRAARLEGKLKKRVEVELLAEVGNKARVSFTNTVTGHSTN